MHVVDCGYDNCEETAEEERAEGEANPNAEDVALQAWDACLRYTVTHTGLERSLPERKERKEQNRLWRTRETKSKPLEGPGARPCIAARSLGSGRR